MKTRDRDWDVFWMVVLDPDHLSVVNKLYLCWEALPDYGTCMCYHLGRVIPLRLVNHVTNLQCIMAQWTKQNEGRKSDWTSAAHAFRNKLPWNYACPNLLAEQISAQPCLKPASMALCNFSQGNFKYWWSWKSYLQCCGKESKWTRNLCGHNAGLTIQMGLLFMMGR